ncbi:MAG: class I SAM-dependent methyltransferase [Nakamurella sp.]
MSLDRRALAEEVLRDARLAGYPPGQYVQQESFATARDVLSLARQSGVGRDTEVLDLCCGIAGFGRHLTRELGCRYVGIDQSAAAIDLARQRSTGLTCQFITATIPPIPAGEYDVVLLLETVLAFRNKDVLVSDIAGVLRPGGRFACTIEAGVPLSVAERAAMPQSDTVWPIPLAEFTALLASSGLTVSWVRDDSTAHLCVVDGLLAAFAAQHDAVAAGIGKSAIAELIATHQLWSQWIGAGRIRKYAMVAQKA